MTQDLERLRSIKSFPSLVKYLRDELDWPIEPADVEDLTFEYEAEELGLDAKTAAKIKEIKQLRPFVTGQPWGIFYINFEPKQLPIVALRRILSKLVLKKRASGNKSQQASWQLNDLLFISSYGESDERAISFAHFSEDKQFGDLPTLRVLGWDSQDTVLRLEDVEQTLRNKLRWPEDENNVDDWRKSWSSAFTLRHREVVKTSKELAVKLADLAIVIRQRANKVLSIESDKGPMRKLYKAFQEALIHDLDEDDFADMYAQTIAYGLLTARVSRPAGLVVENVTDMVPITNPFLKELLQTFLTVGGRKGKIDFDELGINEVVELLRIANMEAVLKDFGDRNPLEDPVIHFYELFLKEYDPKKRMQRGVFYTPRPVVSFIVRSVDEILRTEFGLEDGLADITTWGEMGKRLEGLIIPKGVKPDEPFVQILDPATGTGTFLVEVIHRIYQTLRAKWTSEKKNAREMDGLWNDYVPQHLLPRLHGFELMMAPYAIAHMKIGLKLRETHYSFLSSERARIYLTNTLEEPKDFSSYFEQMAPALAHEAQAANDVKRNTPITVVIGNPPYSVHSVNTGQWITHLLRGRNTQSDAKTENYFEFSGSQLGERNPKALNDDYVKFIRVAQLRIEQSGCGILAFISNHGYLDNPTFRGMRQSILQTFSDLFFIDLHGNSNKKERCPDGSKDENVFDIQQGVAIGFFLKNPHIRRAAASVQIADLWGLRERHGENPQTAWSNGGGKFEWLEHNTLDTAKLNVTTPNMPFLVFARQDMDLASEYYAFQKIDEALPINSSGMNTARDLLVVDVEREVLLRRIHLIADKGKNLAEVADLLKIKSTPWWDFAKAAERLREASGWETNIIRCLYRPFDQRWLFHSSDFIDRPRTEVNSNMLRDNLSFVTTRQTKEPFAVVATNLICGQHKIAAVYDRSYFFPLYIYPKTGTENSLLSSSVSDHFDRRTNFAPQFVADFSTRLKISFLSDGRGNLDQNFGSEDVFHYFYAVLHSPTYRYRYAGFLKTDFPRIPLTSSVDLFRELCALGADLVALHLLEDNYKAASWNTSQSNGKSPLKTPVTRFAGNDSAKVGKGYPKYKGGNVYINPARYFEGVPEEVWNFHIGGYQVCEKWLKDRRERTLSDEDINHYQRVVVALNETIRLMAEIDRVIDEHGGWPLARAEDAVEPSGERLRDQLPLMPLPAQIRYPQPDHAVYMMRVILSMLQHSGGSINMDRLMNACSLLAMPDTLETHGADIEANLAHEWRSRFSDHFNPDLFLSKVDDLVQRAEIRLLREGSGFQMVRVSTLELPTDAHIEFDAWFALRVADSLIQTELEAFPPLATHEQIEERSSAA
jgi:hypothetical protein